MSPFNRAFLKAAGAGVGTLALAGERALVAERQPAQPASDRHSEIVAIGAGAFGGWTALYLR